MEYYSALNNIHGLPEDIMPSEISQTQKDKHCMIPLIGWT
jgi:hypothetical protein